jgi:hypothetical protein
MGDHDDRGAGLVPQDPQQLQHPCDIGAVELAGGLVGQQQRRLVRDRHGDGEPLLLATGQRTDRPAARGLEAGRRQQRAGPLATARGRHARQAHGQLEVLRGTGVRQEVAGRGLEHEADPAAAERGEPGLR